MSLNTKKLYFYIKYSVSILILFLFSFSFLSYASSTGNSSFQSGHSSDFEYDGDSEENKEGEEGESSNLSDSLVSDMEDLSLDFAVLFKTVPTLKYKKRLFVGEADFSYTRALVEKHSWKYPGLSKFIVATELLDKEKLEKSYLDTFSKNIAVLNKYGINPEFEVNATKIHETYAQEKFKRIHFNFPMSIDTDYKSGEPKKLIKDFFNSAKELQKEGDRIHVVLPNEDWREGVIYDIYNASSNAGYKEIKRHKFNNSSYKEIKGKKERYRGYKHVQNKCVSNEVNECTKNLIRNAKEHVFVKVGEASNTLKKKIEKVSPPKKRKTYYSLTSKVKTDTESSDYFDISSDGGLSDVEKRTNNNSMYNDNIMEFLLHHYFNNTNGIGSLGVMTPINANANDGDTLLTNLRTRDNLITNSDTVVEQLLVPINLGEYDVRQDVAGDHWVGVRIIRPTRERYARIQYFDPLGDGMPLRLRNILLSVYPNAKIIINRIRYQIDGYNCGPWVIATFRNLVEKNNLADEEGLFIPIPFDFNIDKARSEFDAQWINFS